MSDNTLELYSHICQFSHHCDKIPIANNLKEDLFGHSLGGLGPGCLVSGVCTEKALPPLAGRKLGE